MTEREAKIAWLEGELLRYCGPIFVAPTHNTYPGEMIGNGTYALIDTDLTAVRITPNKGGIAQISGGHGAEKPVHAKTGESKPGSASAPTQTTVAGQTVAVPAMPEAPEVPNAAEKATEKAKDALKKLPGIFKKKKDE